MILAEGFVCAEDIPRIPNIRNDMEPTDNAEKDLINNRESEELLIQLELFIYISMITGIFILSILIILFFQL